MRDEHVRGARSWSSVSWTAWPFDRAQLSWSSYLQRVGVLRQQYSRAILQYELIEYLFFSNPKDFRTETETKNWPNDMPGGVHLSESDLVVVVENLVEEMIFLSNETHHRTKQIKIPRASVTHWWSAWACREESAAWSLLLKSTELQRWFQKNRKPTKRT